MPFSPGIFSNIYRNCTILRKRAEKAAEKNRYFPPLWVYRFFTGLLSPISSLKFALFNQELNYFAVVSMPHTLFVYSMHKKAFCFTAKRLFQQTFSQRHPVSCYCLFTPTAQGMFPAVQGVLPLLRAARHLCRAPAYP